MSRIQGRTVLVTGASAGIGRACALAFARKGARLALCARRVDRLEGLADELRRDGSVDLHLAALDVTDRVAVESYRDELDEAGFSPDVLVNNAGLARGLHPLHEGVVEDWEEMIDTNFKGLLYVTRAFLPGMVRRDRGHVVNIGSIAGHMVYPRGNVYNATKYAVRALTEAISIDLVGTKVRVSSVDPGAVETEFSLVRFRGDDERASQVYEGFTPLTPEDVADAVLYVVGTPEHVNVLDLVLMPTDQRNPYVLHRRGEEEG